MKFVALLSFITFSLVAVSLILGANPFAISKKAKQHVEEKIDKLSDTVGSAVPKPDFSKLKQCEYFRVSTKPFLCARGELILVAADKAPRYCSTRGFSQQLDDKIYCQFNGVDSKLKIHPATPF